MASTSRSYEDQIKSTNSVYEKIEKSAVDPNHISKKLRSYILTYWELYARYKYNGGNDLAKAVVTAAALNDSSISFATARNMQKHMTDVYNRKMKLLKEGKSDDDAPNWFLVHEDLDRIKAMISEELPTPVPVELDRFRSKAISPEQDDLKEILKKLDDYSYTLKEIEKMLENNEMTKENLSLGGYSFESRFIKAQALCTKLRDDLIDFKKAILDRATYMNKFQNYFMLDWYRYYETDDCFDKEDVWRK